MRSPAIKIIPDPLSLRSLYLLTLALCLSLSPHIVRVPTWLSLTAASAVLYMLASLYWNLSRPKTWMLWLLVSICLIGVTLHHGRLFSRDAGVSLLVVMLSLKLLETRRHRDGMVMAGLLYFSVITHFLYDQTIPLLLFMLCAVSMNTLALITLNENSVQISLRRRVRMVGVLMLSALPIMLVLFVLFPRIPGPIWGLPQDAFSARTGLSDSMSPNDISNVVLSDEPAFRVVFRDLKPRPEQLYWRTLVLGNFDGRAWRVDDKSLATEPEHLTAMGEPLNYTITVEPHQRRWLFALDMPILQEALTWPNGEKPFLTGERLLRTMKPVTHLARYSITSYPRYKLGSELNRYQRQRALQLPSGFNPRSLELARSWRQKTQQPRELVGYALAMFRQDFTYTLKSPLLGFHSVDEFLFESKRGFCEHFAGSFVFLMRAAGVPARVVTGYQGGEFNPLDDYLLVRQSDAHAWAEVWMEGQGWVRIDPTTAVSPARIELGLNEAIPPDERAGLFYRRDYPVIYHLGLLWDAMDNRWNLWVLGYGQKTQLEFLSKLGFGSPDFYTMTLAMLLGVGLLLIATVLLGFRRKQQPDDPLLKIYLRLCARLSKMGYARPNYEGPRDFAARIKSLNPALGELLEPVFNLYATSRYGEQGVPHAAAQTLRKKVRDLKPMLKKDLIRPSATVKVRGRNSQSPGR
jgi:protein-glutamine gamma-glutamyltransferase